MLPRGGSLVSSLGLPGFRAKQLSTHYFSRLVDDPAEMTDLPAAQRDTMVESLLRCGVNRVSLGVQSFVDKEAASVGRLHTHAVVMEELARLRAHLADELVHQLLPLRRGLALAQDGEELLVLELRRGFHRSVGEGVRVVDD